MGLGEMLGIKNIKIETKTPMTLEEFFDKIKDVTFEAGVPSIVKHGFNTVICFPKIDRENQIWITGDKGKFTVMRSTVIAGLGESIKNQLASDVLNAVTDGAATMFSQLGNPKKTCMALCDKVADTIKSLDL